MKLPEGYRGIVAVVSPAEEASRRPEEPEVVDLEAEVPLGTLQAEAEFDEIVVWGHEVAVDGAADPYLRGAEEWLALADKVGKVGAADVLCLVLIQDRSTRIPRPQPRRSECTESHCMVTENILI